MWNKDLKMIHYFSGSEALNEKVKQKSDSDEGIWGTETRVMGAYPQQYIWNVGPFQHLDIAFMAFVIVKTNDDDKLLLGLSSNNIF